ncbi:hypothetical protein T3H00_22410 [Pseudomonas fluorescens]|uniref:hypothetical protein n=1 Tax=Pseudomonas fluorescens TaxID=294 RepID=UPI002ACA25B9|nr:hypothetical protein [Pseudomonas fluorescens]MDZ5435401.1 hypothetical protein [Pseudomonas fluorescens]
MNRHIAYPFLTCTENDIAPSPWALTLNETTTVAIEQYIPGWDYSSKVEFNRTIQINKPQLSVTLGIPLEFLKLEIITIIGTGQGRIPRSKNIINKYPIEEEKTTYELIIPCQSNMLSKRVKIETYIVISSAPSNPSLLSPTVVGSKVWSDEIDLRLEGDEPRFPMETASFKKMFPNRNLANSLWYLSWGPEEWDEDFIGSVRLYINTDHAEFIKRFLELDKYTHQTIMSDIITQILSKFLADPTAEESFNNFEDGTVGFHASNWIINAFPEQSYSSVKSLFEHRPGDFHATILALSDFRRHTNND